MDAGSRARGVSDIIDQQPLSRFQISTIVLCGVVLILDGFDAQAIGYVAPAVSDDLGIPLNTFGPILSAGLFGLMVAAMGIGPIADRWGRKWTVVASTLTFAVFSILTAHAATYNELLLFRFLTGLGLGGAMPNVVALTSEYSPRRLVPVFVGALFAGMPLGGLLCGLASSVMLPRWGWESVFYLGGILPLIMALALVKVLPESVQFMAVRGDDPRKIAAVLGQISPGLAEVPAAELLPREKPRKSAPVKGLFTEGRAAGTLLLWVPFFMNLLTLYFIVSWLPALAREAGVAVEAGVWAVTLFGLGGVIGSLVEGRLMNRWGARTVLAAEFLASSALAGSLAFLTVALPLLLGVTCLLGFCVTAAQAGLNGLAAKFYPTAIRSTGVGWALGVGRIGSIVGPMIAGVLLGMGWQPQQIFLAGAVPAALAAGAILAGHRLRGSATAAAAQPAESDAA